MHKLAERLHLRRNKSTENASSSVGTTASTTTTTTIPSAENSFAQQNFGHEQARLQQGGVYQQGVQQGVAQPQVFGHQYAGVQSIPQQQGSLVQPSQPWTNTAIQQQEHVGIMKATTRAPTVETHVRPAIIQQTTRIDKVLEVQPIIHREIDATEVRVIERHTYETAPSSGPGFITNQPIIEETIRPRIIEEVHPVLHRSVPAPFIERVEQHIQENVTAPTTTTKQVMSQNRIVGLAEATERGFISAPIATQQRPQEPIFHTQTAPATTQSTTRNTILEQTLRPEKVTEVQPIIHREIDAPQVRMIERHSYEKMRSAGSGLITKQPIIEERVTPRVVEEIYPIVHRDVPAPYVEHVEQHTQEHVTAPTTTTKQVFSETHTAAPVARIPTTRAVPTAPVVQSTLAPSTTEQHTLPTILQQTTRSEKITQVQPVIHREIDAPQVRLIEQHTYERVPSTGAGTITRPTIVEETIIPSIIEEIQPIVHREVPQVVIEHQEQHLQERVVLPTTTTKQVTQERGVISKALPTPPVVKSLPSLPVVHSTTATPTIESITRPTVVEQTSRPERVTEVQPIIHREIDAPQVRLIEQHMYERVPSVTSGLVTKQTIVEETVHPRIIEEIQPVLHRDVPAPFIERVEQHTTERVVQPTQSTKEVIVDNTPTLVNNQGGFVDKAPSLINNQGGFVAGGVGTR